MRPDGFDVPPVRPPLVPRTQRVPRAGDEPDSRRNPETPERRRKNEPETPRPAPNDEHTGHRIDLET